MTRSSSRLRSAPRSADDPTQPGVTAEPRAPSSASVRSSAASDSDTENAERPVRQQLRKATLGPAYKETLPENHTMGEASDTAKEAYDKPTEKTIDQDAESNGKRGRVSRKRSFEQAETEQGDDLKVEKHSRKRSRDFTISGNEPEVTRRKTSGENSEQGSEDDIKAPESASVERNAKDAANDRAVTPEIAKEHGNAVMSPKNKRNREEFEEEEITATSLSNNNGGDAPKQDESDDASGPEGAERSDVPKKAKRHRDSDSSQPEVKDKSAADAKPAETKIPPSSGFSNTSTVSPFGALAGNKSPPAAAAPQTSESAFKASGFGALASTASPFATMAGKPAASPFATAAAGAKPAISGLSSSSSTSAFGGLSASSEGKSAFATAGSSGFGGLVGGFGSGSGFGGIGSGSKLGGFGGGSGPKITGLSDKPAKPFGAAADDEEEGSGDDGDEEGNKSPIKAQQDEDKKDERFFEQNVETGEENEETMFVSRAKLYIWNSDDARWQERAVGNLKVNVVKQSKEDKKAKVPKKARFIMRSDGSHRLALNSPIQKELKVGGDAAGKRPVNKTIMFQGRLDEGEGLRTLSLKMKEENAIALWEKVTALQEEM
ncbi:hypothetical protein K490DRAFT_52692 [Saccharata proteae CBS 121410]|uniref:RanBD1 domain-containing protein n=1 Tax=Saccharata proteae CBS 121410 TaxID=1314787 RepID=A0A9P4I450_9PEZI|nr:hypothetical protein K490DRAFT_52692 [Saccharata proteae CBS 121410]